MMTHVRVMANAKRLMALASAMPTSLELNVTVSIMLYCPFRLTEKRLPECSIEILLFLLQLNVKLMCNVRVMGNAKRLMALASAMPTSLGLNVKVSIML